MTPSAVIFDLGGTLMDTWDFEKYTLCVREMAKVLPVDADNFVSRWMDPETARKSLIGDFPNNKAVIEYCCGRSVEVLGLDNVIEALRVHDAFAVKTMVPRDGAIEVLSELKSRGYRIGLLSDCGRDVPQYWDTTEFAPYFDGLVFSCETGTKKPDPAIFRLACGNVGAKPEECVYVADGNSNELSGARNVGMSPVLICTPHEREMIMQREEPRHWNGPVIENLRQLLVIL